MARINAKIFAQALYELCLQTKDLDKLLRDFSALIVKQYGFGSLAEIIRQFDGVYNLNEKAVDVRVTSAYKLEADNLKKISQAIQTIMQAKQVFVAEKVEPEMIGGIKILAADMEYDSTIKNKLKLIKNNI